MFKTIDRNRIIQRMGLVTWSAFMLAMVSTLLFIKADGNLLLSGVIGVVTVAVYGALYFWLIDSFDAYTAKMNELWDDSIVAVHETRDEVAEALSKETNP